MKTSVSVSGGDNLFKHLITILFQSILQMWRESEKYSIAIKLSNSNAAWAGSLYQQLDDAQSAALNNIAKLIGTKAGNLNNLNLLKISMYKICIVRQPSSVEDSLYYG